MFRVLFEFPLENIHSIKEKTKEIEKVIFRKKSYGYEVDLTTNDPDGTVRYIKDNLGNYPFRVIQEQEILKNPNLIETIDVFRRSMILFREERYWESHVLLETVWRNSHNDLKRFLQTVILLAASQVHFQMSEKETAHIQYNRAYKNLQNSEYRKIFHMIIPGEFVYPLFPEFDIPSAEDIKSAGDK